MIFFPLIVHSFVEIVQYLFKVPGVKFILSEHFCQDPLEKYFGKQRQRGAANENPSVLQVINNAPAI